MGEQIIKVQSFLRGDYDAIFVIQCFYGLLLWEIGKQDEKQYMIPSSNELAKNKLLTPEKKSILVISLHDDLLDFPKEMKDTIYSNYNLKEKLNLLELSKPYQGEYIKRTNLYNISVNCSTINSK